MHEGSGDCTNIGHLTYLHINTQSSCCAEKLSSTVHLTWSSSDTNMSLCLLMPIFVRLFNHGKLYFTLNDSRIVFLNEMGHKYFTIVLANLSAKRILWCQLIGLGYFLYLTFDMKTSTMKHCYGGLHWPSGRPSHCRKADLHKRVETILISSAL